MTLTRLTERARPFVIGAALVLFVDLFLNWHEASVNVPGVDIKSGTSGLSGWGIVAAILVAAIVLWETRSGSLRRAFGALVLAVALLASTIAEFVSGKAHVDVANVVGISVDHRLWPAYVGVVLAVAAVAGTLVQVVSTSQAHTRTRPGGAARGVA